MIEWAEIKRIIKRQIVEVTNLPEANVKWKDESEGSVWAGMPAIYLNVIRIGTNGGDEERREFADGLTPNDPSSVNLCGQREFTLQCRVESFEQDIAKPDCAQNIASNIEVRLRRATLQEERRDWFGFGDIGARIRTEYKKNGRMVNVFVLDLLCLTVDNDVDDSLGAGDWIGRVLVDSDELKQPDGNPFPEQIALDVDERD